MAYPTSGFIDRVLTYGAVSYGFGFLVVMLHTWRLGLPVISLADPIYVWLGLPFAIVAFYATPIFTVVRNRAIDVTASTAEAFKTDKVTPNLIADTAAT